MIEILKMLNAKNMYGNSQHIITSYIIMYLHCSTKQMIIIRYAKEN